MNSLIVRPQGCAVRPTSSLAHAQMLSIAAFFIACCVVLLDRQRELS